MKAEYAMCPRCSNVRKGHRVLRCGDCEVVFCEACQGRRGTVLGIQCPQCYYSNWKMGEPVLLGKISGALGSQD